MLSLGVCFSYSPLQRGNHAIASEVFVVVSLTLFLPICLEQFARDNGFLQPEKTEPCSSLSGTASTSADVRCAVKIGWLWIDTASFR
jgi:UMF1 family MFS transporter